MARPNDDAPVCYDAVVRPDADGLAHDDGRVMAVGGRMTPDTGRVSAYPWTGYRMTPGEALRSLERVLREWYGQPAEARRVQYEARE